MAKKQILRLFIAVTLNDKMKDAISEVQEELYFQGVRGNFTKTENLHFTLIRQPVCKNGMVYSEIGRVYCNGQLNSGRLSG